MADLKKMANGTAPVPEAVARELMKLVGNNGRLTDEQQKVIRERDAIYMDLAGVITKKVPVSELGYLIEWLGKYRESFEAEVTFHEAFDTFPQDGAVAVYRALKDKFGFVDHQQTWAGAQMMTVQIGPGQTIQVPWGKFGIPGIEGAVLVVGTHPTKDTFHFCISGVVKKKDHDVIVDIVNRVRENLKTHSIYKGKAITMKFNEDFNPMSYQPDDVAPEFMDVSNIDQSELVLSKHLQEMVQDNLFTPIEKTELCRSIGLPLRRGVLLAGTYGVGKTLTSQIQALKATQNGWTFIYLKDVADLAEGLQVAKQYAPAVVFAEDIDSIMGGDERTDEMNEILNTIDGIELKGKDVLVVLTTNFVEKINPAMIRPGRIDALIEMTPPDADAAQRLLRVYGKDLIEADADLTVVGKILDGHRPAMIAETVQRAKLSAISRMGASETKANFKIVSSDLEIAARSMDHHVALVNGKTAPPPTANEVIGQAMVDTVAIVSKKNGKSNGASAS